MSEPTWQSSKDELLEHCHRQRAEIELLRSVAYAARKMPRWTPKGGGASTKHAHQIMACDTWALDAALKDLDAPAPAPPNSPSPTPPARSP